jgi:putative transposase
MSKKLFRNRHYNTPGHAHELIFSCYRRIPFFNDKLACEKFLFELNQGREDFSFLLWAYVIMPNHIHLLIWPTKNDYNIAKITKSIKGRLAKKYLTHLKETKNTFILNQCSVVEKGMNKHRFWQRGGGFDRNLWNPKAIHDSISYIEANPVRSKRVSSPEEWLWSSARARKTGKGVVPDVYTMPVKLDNPQNQRVGIV